MRLLQRLIAAGLLVLVTFSVTVVAQAQEQPTVQVTNDPTLGPLLTDSNGNTLYRFTNDEPNVSNCTGGCLATWPPLLVNDPAALVAGDGVNGTLGTIAMEDGSLHVTYNDMPLYFFANDAAPGDTNGQDVRNIWFVVPPDAPTVTVADQPIANGTVTIERVVVAEPGWLVVHAQADGRPGPILGQTALTPGENLNVVVSIDESRATPVLYAMLHSDRGAIGTFEFPGGTDIPVTLGGQVVTPPFNVVQAPQVQPTAPAPAPTPTPAPPVQLPETGTPGDQSTVGTPLLLGLAFGLLVAGSALLLRRRAR